MLACSSENVGLFVLSTGIARSAFGDEDLRTWFGAFASVRDNVLGSIEYLRKSGLISRDVKTHGLILDTNQGTIEVVVDGDLIREGATLPAVGSVVDKTRSAIEEKGKREAVAESATATAPPQVAHPHAEQAPKKGPIVVGQPVAKPDRAAAPGSVVEAALILRDFFNRERQSQQMQKAIADLRSIWRQEKNPYHVVAELQKIGRAYETQYPRLPGAFAYLEDAIRSGSADKIGFGEIMKRIFD